MSSSAKAWDIGACCQEALKIWHKEICKHPNHEIDIFQGQLLVDGRLNKKDKSGNGSLMRCAPVALAFCNNESQARKVAREQSEITHPYPVNGDTCALYTGLIIAALRGASKEKLAAQVASEDVSDRQLRERLSKYKSRGDWQDVGSVDMKCRGWVIDTLEVALWAFFSTNSFRGGAIACVNLGMYRLSVNTPADS